MQTIEGIKKRLKTTASLRDIVKSMKTLSAVSVSQYERSAFALAEYAGNVELALRAVLGSEPLPAPLYGTKDSNVIAVIFGTDQGLVGRFNKALADFAMDFLSHEAHVPANVSLIVGGRKLASKIASSGKNIDTLFTMPGSVRIISATAKKIIMRIDELVSGGSRVYLFYNKKTSGSFEPCEEQILPIPRVFLENVKSRRWPTHGQPIYTAQSAELMSGFMRQHLFVSVYRALSNSLASEHFMRMVAMGAAENNIEERLEKIRLEYQTRRQTEITSELIDVVVGAEALAPVRRRALP